MAGLISGRGPRRAAEAGFVAARRVLAGSFARPPVKPNRGLSAGPQRLLARAAGDR